MSVSLCRPLLAALAAGFAALASAAPAPTRDLVLAGGSLAICSDLAPRACIAPPSGAGRAPARFRLDDEGIARALQAPLWTHAGAPDAALRERWLEAARGSTRGEVLEAAEMEDALAATCLAERCDDTDPARPWSVLLDAERAAVLAALEVPALDGQGQRPRERALPEASRDGGGVEVLRAFVDAAQARTMGRPKIAVVTASAFDPMDPVDFYLDVFRRLGADAVWWPVDGAAAEARFERGDCTALPALRVQRLKLANREAVYPDLARYQEDHCASQPAILLQVQGVFFAGGDQWRHRQAFFQSDGRPNAWWRELQQAHAAGHVVVGGTSAGAAVQSASWMLGNGDVTAAVARSARIAPPPEPGCARGGRCGAVPEDALTLWPDGGLRFADDAIVDTHFSERARELRLLMAMQAADARWGYGADETSALRVREMDGRREIDALGAAGGWVFRRDAGMRDEVEAWYLAPGARLVVEQGLPAGHDGADAHGERVRLVIESGTAPAKRRRLPRLHSAFESGALRHLAQRLAWRCGRVEALPASPGRAELTCAEGARGWAGGNGMHGIGPLRLRFVRAGGSPPPGRPARARRDLPSPHPPR